MSRAGGFLRALPGILILAATALALTSAPPQAREHGLGPVHSQQPVSIDGIERQNHPRSSADEARPSVPAFSFAAPDAGASLDHAAAPTPDRPQDTTLY